MNNAYKKNEGLACLATIHKGRSQVVSFDPYLNSAFLPGFIKSEVS